MLFTLKPRLKVSLISLILIFSLTEVSQAHHHHSYSHDGGRHGDNPNWMSVLSDSVRLSELSIPGTHESLSFYGGGGIPRDIMKTQSMTLRFQLESGIRVFDIRCAIVGNSFNIYHGSVYQHENFDGVLKTVVAFLRDHPRETVLMRVKEERTDLPGRFEEIFRDTYWNNKDYKDFMWKWTSENPTLDEMRGKIVILQDFARWQCPKPESPSSPTISIHPEYGICYNSFIIQDEFKLGSNWGLYNKWLWVKNYLAAADKDADKPGNKDKKFMNYLSASGGSFPYFVVSGHSNPATGADRLSTGIPAYTVRSSYWENFPRLPGLCPHIPGRCIFFEGTNTLVYGAIRTGYYTKRVGIIMTDFPGKGLVERIICINYPKTDALCKRLPK